MIGEGTLNSADKLIAGQAEIDRMRAEVDAVVKSALGVGGILAPHAKHEFWASDSVYWIVGCEEFHTGSYVACIEMIDESNYLAYGTGAVFVKKFLGPAGISVARENLHVFLDGMMDTYPKVRNTLEPILNLAPV